MAFAGVLAGIRLTPHVLRNKEYPAILRTSFPTKVALRATAALTCFMVLGLLALPWVAAADPVLRVASSTVELPIAVELPAGTTIDATACVAIGA